MIYHLWLISQALYGPTNLHLNDGRRARCCGPEFQGSLAKLLLLLERIRQTDELIDAVVYRLYGRTEEEIKIVRRNESMNCGYIAQFTQSISELSLKPGEEEIKKRGWWQFWGRD